MKRNRKDLNVMQSSGLWISPANDATIAGNDLNLIWQRKRVVRNGIDELKRSSSKAHMKFKKC